MRKTSGPRSPTGNHRSRPWEWHSRRMTIAQPCTTLHVPPSRQVDDLTVHVREKQLTRGGRPLQRTKRILKLHYTRGSGQTIRQKNKIGC